VSGVQQEQKLLTAEIAKEGRGERRERLFACLAVKNFSGEKKQ
jgi:hypothetical protein